MKDWKDALKYLTSEDWLYPFSSQQFSGQVSHYYERFSREKKPLRIFLALSNPEEFLAIFLASVSAGCHIFLCNPDWQAGEWQQVYNLAKPDVIFDGSPGGQWQIGPDSDCNLPKPSILIPTGGTSGKIRFAIHTTETLSASVAGFKEYYGLEEINSFCTLPFYHVSGLMQFLRSFLTGGKFIYYPYSELKRQAPHYPHSENCFISLVPTQLQYLLRHQPRWLSSFSTVLVGGAPSDRLCLEEARLAGVKISLTYGMTETASQIVNLKPEEFLVGNNSNGRVLPHAEVSIYNEKNQDVEKGDIGSIAIKSLSLFLGYYPELNPSEIFHTDDMGYMDDEGYLHIIGRNSQKIITGGENVYPAEVETVIKDTKLVKDVAVIGYPDQRWGQIVVAFYVPLDEQLKAQDIESRLRMLLAKYKIPKLWRCLESIPRNSVGKINYQQLKSLV